MALTGEEGLAWRAAERAKIRGETMTISEARRIEVERNEKAKVKALLAQTDKLGKNATRVATSLLGSDMSYSDILAAARRASPDATDSVHRTVIRPDASLMEREEPEVEEDWLRQAREEAERAWTALYPQRKSEAAQLRSLKPSDIAFGRMASSLAQTAAGLDYDEGQKRHRGDDLDAELQRRGESAARRLWPGR
jgi:hypothetical protein